MYALQTAAEKFIQSSALFDFLRRKGELHFTGSYFLETMTWPDVDVQLTLAPCQDPRKTMGELLSNVWTLEGHKKIQVMDCGRYPRQGMPSGLYLGVTQEDQALGGDWKVDVWILETAEVQRHRALMEELKARMTPEKHALIMGIKRGWLRRHGRSPQGGSHFLYQAVLLDDIKEPHAIESYLKAHGVKVES